MITVGIVAIEILAYQVLIRYLPILPNPHSRRNIALPETHPAVRQLSAGK